MPGASGTHPCFGELALMYSKPRAASVVASVQGKLWKLGREAFRLVQMLRTNTAIDFTKIMRRVEVLSALRFDQLQQLRDRMVERTFAPNDYVFKQGERGDTLYIIARGRAEVVKKGESGEEEVVMQLQKNAYFGERALLRDEPRGASIRATSEASLVTACISREDFEKRLGPLQNLLDDHRREREAAVRTQQSLIDRFGLSTATRDQFVVQAKIDEVPCGVVLLVKHLSTSQTYTMREEGTLPLQRAGEISRTHRELELLSEIAAAKVPIPVLPTLLRAFTSPLTRCMLFRQRAVCALSQIAAASPGGVLAARELLFTGACIARALDALHTHLEHMYRNLAPERISVLDDGYVCLMDHRFSKRDDGACTTLCGSPSFLAPEAVRGDVQGYPVDWWGYGVLMFELATGDSPWGATDDDDMVLLKRISSHTSGALAVPAHVNPQLSALINDLLEPDPETRRGDGSVVADAWFDEISWSRLLDAELPSPLLNLASRKQEELNSSAGWEEVEPPDWDTFVPPGSAADDDDDDDEVNEEGEFTFGAQGSSLASKMQSTGSVLSQTRAAREMQPTKKLSFSDRVQERMDG